MDIAPGAISGGTAPVSGAQSNNSVPPPSMKNAPSSQGGGAATAEPAAAKTTTSVDNAAEPLFEVKVNGKVIKMTRQEALDRASMSYAANEKWNEAASMRKQTEEFKNKIKKDFIEALQEQGLTKEQIRNHMESWYMKEFIEPETLTADQKKVREYEVQLAKYKEQEELEKQRRLQDEETKLTNQQREFLQSQIIEAMEKSGLPKTKFFASRMAFYMRENLKNGWDAPIDMIVRQVKNERKSMISDLSEGSTVEQLIDMLGDGIINKIRVHDLKQLREKRNFPNISPSSAQSNSSSNEKMSSADVNKRLREMREGKRSF